MQPFEHRSVSKWSKEINGTLTGGRKNYFFLIRELTISPWRAAPVESCRFVVLRSPRGRLGSVQDVGSRLRRMHRCFHRWIPMRTGAQLPRGLDHDPQRFRSRALWRAPRTGACGVGDYLTLDLSRRASTSRSTPEKSVQVGPDGAPFPSKTSITRGPPVVAVAVSLDPILPQR